MITRYLFIAVFLLGVLLPQPAEAAPVNFFGPIVPEACKCDDIEFEGKIVSSAPAYGCVLQIIQNIIRFAITLGIVLATLALVYAGFVWMTSRGNPEKISRGRTMLLNVFIGLAVLLGAWLLVDFVMKTLYTEPTEFGPWNSILAPVGDSSGVCLNPRNPSALVSGFAVLPISTNPPPASTGTGAGTGSNCPAADPSSMQAFPASATDGEAEKATPTTVQNFLAMQKAAAQAGITLKVTDGYRSDAEQVQLWNRYNQDSSQVAKPCSLGGSGSNHNSGTALDIAVGCAKTNSSCNSPAYRWLKENGGKWGFRNNLPNDVVHWSPSGR